MVHLFDWRGIQAHRVIEEDRSPAKVKTEIETFSLERANEALTRLGIGEIRGAAVLVMD